MESGVLCICGGIMTDMIQLPHGGKDSLFNPDDLVEYVKEGLRYYIIQGQKGCSLNNHPRPRSLDYWLRVNYADNKKQALSSLVDALVETGKFEVVKKLKCPDTGNLCRGVRLR